MLSYPLRLECQNKFRIDTQSRWASGNPPLRDIASNNISRVGNLDHQSLLRRGQSFRTGHNMPFNSTPKFPFLVHRRNTGMKVLEISHATSS